MSDLILGLLELFILYRNQIGLILSGWGGWYIIQEYNVEIHKLLNIILFIILFLFIFSILFLLYWSYNIYKNNQLNKYRAVLKNTDFQKEPIMTIIGRFMRYTKEPLRAMVLVMEDKGKVNKFILEGKFKKFTPMNASRIIMEFRRLNYGV